MVRSENLNYIEEMMDIFHNSTGIPCVLFDNEGNEIYSRKKAYNYCDYFQEISNCPHNYVKEHLESRNKQKS